MVGLKLIHLSKRDPWWPLRGLLSRYPLIIVKLLQRRLGTCRFHQQASSHALQLLDFTHFSLDKMAAISQATFSDTFSWIKIFIFWCEFHGSLFLRVQLTICQHWFMQFLGHEWGNLSIIVMNDTVTTKKHWWNALRITKKSCYFQ